MKSSCLPDALPTELSPLVRWFFATRTELLRRLSGVGVWQPASIFLQELLRVHLCYRKVLSYLLCCYEVVHIIYENASLLLKRNRNYGMVMRVSATLFSP
jgi:hypothetical protein